MHQVKIEIKKKKIEPKHFFKSMIQHGAPLTHQRPINSLPTIILRHKYFETYTRYKVLKLMHLCQNEASKIT